MKIGKRKYAESEGVAEATRGAARWRKAMLTVLVLLFTAVLSFAVGQVVPAGADEEGVLDGNTAEYTFENDEKYPWTYNREENVWTSTNGCTVEYASATLKLSVTSAGNIALDYYMDLSYSGGGFTITVNGTSGSKELVSIPQSTFDDYKTLEPFAVTEGDIVLITFKLSWDTDDYYYAKIRGLNRPNETVPVTAKAGENGTLSYKGANENTFTESVLFGGLFDVEAKADEGYVFAYWENAEHQIISRSAKLDHFHLTAETYTAIFYKIGEVTTSISQIDGKDTWKKTTDGDYYEADMAVIQSGQTGTLTYDFTGDGYFCFDYRKSVYTNEYIYVNLDGVRVFSDNSYNNNYSSVDKMPWEHKSFVLPNDGFHRLEFVYADAGSEADPGAGHFDIIHVKDVKTPVPEADLQLVSYELTFNADIGDVYIVAAESTPEIQEFLQDGQKLVSGQQQELPIGLTVFFGIFPHTEYQSTIDPSQTTCTAFVGAYLKDGTELGRHELVNAFYVKTIFTEAGIKADDTPSNERYLEFKMQEKAVAPQTVSVNYKVNDDVHDKVEIENGQTYTIPYGSTNQFTFAVSDYPDVNEELKVTANGKMVDTDLVNGFFGFTLNNLVADTTVSIQIEGEYYASDPFLVYINVTLEGQEDIEKYLKPLGKVKVENDENKPWIFTSTYTAEGMIAYMSGYSGGGQGEGTSALKFIVTGGGTLSFDFYFTGYARWQMAGYDYNKALGKPGVGTFNSGKTMAVAGDVEAQILLPDVVTSLKETLGLGWFHANIPVNSAVVGSEVGDNTEVVIYVGYGDNWGSYENDILAIRNVMYLQGKSTVSFNVVDNTGEDGSQYGTIDAKIAGKGVSSGSEADMGDKLVLTAKPSEGNSFYLWQDPETKELISYEPSITYTVVGNISVEAVMAPTGTYAARIGTKFYPTLDAAFNDARGVADNTVIVVDNIIVETATTVEAGIKLVIPFNGDGDYYAEGNSTNATQRVSWGTADLIKKYLFRTVTFKDSLTVKGELYVGGVIHYPNQSAQAHTSGAYSELVLSGEKAMLTVEKDGYVDICGRVTGEGGIVVKEGGQLIQPFLILDFAGGTNTSGLYGQDQTPFNRYAVINVQCAKGLKIEYKGELWGHASLYAMGGVNALDAPIISYSDGTEDEPRGFITLTEGGSVTAIYHDERKIPDSQNINNTVDIGYTELIFDSTTEDGGAIANSLTMTYSIVTISTADVVGFSIPYNYQITLNSGKYSLGGNFKLMPGSSLTIGENATLTVKSGQNLLVYDGLVQSRMSGKSYPSAEELKTAGYSTNGNLIVNGKLIIEAGKEKYPSMFLGVAQTTHAGATIEIGKEFVTLSDKIVDGGETAYDCNYMEYASTGRIWIKNKTGDGGKFLTLEAGKTYVSKGADEFTLPATELKYESGNWGNADAMSKGTFSCTDSDNDGKCDKCHEAYKNGNKHSLAELAHHEHNNSSTYISGATEAVEGLKGSWMVEHGENHVCDDWTLTPDDKIPDGEKFTVLTRTCTVEGCTEKVHRLLLADDFAPTASYKGSPFTKDDLVKLFCQHYFGRDTVPVEYSEYFSVDISFEGTLQGVNPSYSVTVTLMNGFFDDENTTTSKAFKFTVTQYNLADLDKSAIESAIFEKHFTYDGTEKTLDNNELDGLLNSALNAAGVQGTISRLAPVWDNNTEAGENTASVSITGDGNFMGTLVIHFSIAKAGIESVTISGANSFTYDGTAHSVKLTVTANGVNVTDADYDVHYSEDTINVGTVTVTVTAKQDSKNFTGSGTTSFTITRAALTVTIEAKGHTYGESPADLDYTLNGVQNNEESAIRELITLQSEGHDQWAAYREGGYEIKAVYSDTGALKNYTVSAPNGTYTVAKKDISGASFEVTESYTYDGTQKKPTMSEIKVTLSGYDGAHVVTYTVNENSYTNNINATNGVKASFTVTANGNFTGTQTVEFTIGKATVDSVTVTGTYAYNGTELHPTVVVKSGSLTLGTDDYTVSYKHNSKAETVVKNAGEYTVTIALTADCKNYQLGDKTTATFTVEKADITITANDQHTPKGEEILSGDKLTWTVTKTAGGKGEFFEADRDTLKEHISVTTDANKDTIGNNYTITIQWSDGYTPENYEVTFKNGKYSVDDTIWSGVSVTGYEQAIKYDGQVHKLTIEVGNSSLKTTITQKIGDDNFTGAKDVGTYEVTVTITAEDYTSSFTGTYTITITAREVTVTFDSASSTYGDDVKTTFTYQKSGDDVLADDEQAFEAAIAAANPHTTATNTSEVGGKYTITADKPELKNYDITIVDGTYTINARPIEVTVNKQEVTYNQTVQSASSEEQYWSVAGLVNDDTASKLNIKLEATGTDAKAYDITASYENKNYTVTFKDTEGTEGNTIKDAFVIQAAELTEATAAECTYNGSEQTPTFTVKAGSLTVNAEHFTIEYAEGADRVNAGTVKVTIKPIGTNYTGSIETTFEIKAKKITVTLKAQTAEYSGEVPTPKDDAYTVNEGDICSQNGEKDDLGITITLVNGQKDVGSYGLDATASNENYDVNFVKDAKFEVTKKQITVTADNLESVYGDTVKKLTYTADGLIAGEAAEEVLTVTLSADRTIGEVGTYTITGSGSAKNYSFTVTSGTYTVNAREITVHINDQSALYSGTKPTVSQAQGDGWTVTESSIVDGDNLQITLTMEGVTAGDYAITASWNNDKNYKVTFEGSYEGGEKGTFTIQKRALTVVIEPQSATYDPAHSYTFDGAKWHVKDGGDGLAQNETKDILNVTLTKPTMANAGSYDITASYHNGNYDVTFEGEEEAYTVNKKDISEEGDFFLMADGESSVSGLLTVTFAGEDITITGHVLVGEKTLNVNLSKDKITEIGDFDVTVTVDDVNYSGSKTFHVVVKNADGYTKRLVDTLAELAELTEGMTAETLKAEDFEALKQVKALIAALDEEEKGLAEEQLAAYEALIAAWNESAEGLDAKIGTAQSVGDALLDGLFGVAATVSALAAVAFVLRKGGIL